LPSPRFTKATTKRKRERERERRRERESERKRERERERERERKREAGGGFINVTPLLVQPDVDLRELSICISNSLKKLSKHIVYITLCNLMASLKGQGGTEAEATGGQRRKGGLLMRPLYYCNQMLI
jgi:hypothetical protein